MTLLNVQVDPVDVVGDGVAIRAHLLRNEAAHLHHVGAEIAQLIELRGALRAKIVAARWIVV